MSARRQRCNDDVLQEILLRVPAKSLGRFTAANHRWHSLISSPNFQAAQARVSVGKPCGLFTVTTQSSRGRPVYYSLIGNADRDLVTRGLRPTNPNGGDGVLMIKAACNGLVLFELSDGLEPELLVIGNPTIETYWQIPPLLSAWPGNSMFGLAFDLAVATPACKIVNCSESLYRGDGGEEGEFKYQYVFMVYSQELDAWREAKSRLTCTTGPREMFKSVASVFFNGALHWLSKGGYIIAFDLERERASQMAMPDRVEPKPFAGYSTVWFGVANGCMTLVQFINGDIHVWKLTDYGCSEWRFDHRIRTQAPALSSGVKTSIPVFFDSKTAVFMTWEWLAPETTKKDGLWVYRIDSKKWDAVIKLKGWMDGNRIFFPYISHMLTL